MLVDTPIDTLPMFGFAEPIASWIHAAGAIAAVLGLRWLVSHGTTPAAKKALAVFGGATALALALSAIYHSATVGTELRVVLRRLDHAGIWILIAATFTPVHVILFRGRLRRDWLIGIWTAAFIGVVLKTMFFTHFPEAVGLSLYLGLGWLGAVSAAMVGRIYGWRAVAPMLAGGLVYTVGAITSIYGVPVIARGYVAHHEVFHLSVVLALVVHWGFMASLCGLKPHLRSAPAAVPIEIPAAATTLSQPIPVTASPRG